MENAMSVSRSLIVLVMFAFIGGCDTREAEEVQESPLPLAHDAVLAPPGGAAPEISTVELQKILKDQSAVVLDTRPYREWSISHIPGALNVAPKPDVPKVGLIDDNTWRTVTGCWSTCSASRRARVPMV